jgi:glycosyltransferase involved in cell wall biosynthesis
MPTLSVVIPVYNSEQSLPILVDRLAGILPGIAERYEVILVDDASRDGSAAAIRQATRRHGWIRGVFLMRNYGQHNALLCGIRRASYEWIVTIDDDLQNPPEEISKLLELLSNGCDVVYGYPLKENHGLLRDIASRMTKIALQEAMGVETAARVSGFRAFRTVLRDAFATYRGPYVSIDVLLTWGTTRFTAVPVDNPPRALGVSNYTVRRLVIHAMNMITGFTTLPLQAASILGFVFALFGMLVLVYVLVRYLILGGSVPGFPFLASTIAIFSGVQLFALGMIGEYLARVHFRLMDKPSYTVRTET